MKNSFDNPPVNQKEEEPVFRFFGDPESIKNLKSLVEKHRIPKELAEIFLRNQNNEFVPAGIAVVVLNSINKYLKEKYPDEGMTSSLSLQLINGFLMDIDQLIVDPEIARMVFKEINSAIPHLSIFGTRSYPAK